MHPSARTATHSGQVTRSRAPPHAPPPPAVSPWPRAAWQDAKRATASGSLPQAPLPHPLPAAAATRNALAQCSLVGRPPACTGPSRHRTIHPGSCRWGRGRGQGRFARDQHPSTCLSEGVVDTCARAYTSSHRQQTGKKKRPERAGPRAPREQHPMKRLQDVRLRSLQLHDAHKGGVLKGAQVVGGAVGGAKGLLVGGPRLKSKKQERACM